MTKRYAARFSKKARTSFSFASDVLICSTRKTGKHQKAAQALPTCWQIFQERALLSGQMVGVSPKNTLLAKRELPMFSRSCISGS
jgi:hypothetical protein